MSEFNSMQKIKRRFFEMRNGALAESLRRQGAPYKIIFGLNIPQIVEIAQECGINPDLARELRANTSTRESMLLAPMIMDHSRLEYDEAIKWICESPTTEVSDILVHRLLGKLPYSLTLAEHLLDTDIDMAHYGAMRLLFRHISDYPEKIAKYANDELSLDKSITRLPALQLLDRLKD